MAIPTGYPAVSTPGTPTMREHPSGGDLHPASLSAACFWGRFRKADLREAWLRDTCLRAADLRDADLRNADLEGADLDAADLRGANLDGADLRGATFSPLTAWPTASSRSQPGRP
jgi:uncharacterized protein YjbI with pentapeptide repeats